jgi:hypothetical protein
MSNLESHIELREEEMLGCEVSDTALENAAMVANQCGGAATVAFCTGLDTCPA